MAGNRAWITALSLPLLLMAAIVFSYGQGITGNGPVFQLPAATGVYQIGTDLGLSRCAAFQLCIGTGAQGNKGGSVQMASAGSNSGTATGWSMNFNSTGFSMGPSFPIKWGASSEASGYDTGLARSAAGVVEINNGTTGAGGGLKIPALKSTTGTRYVCIDSTGLVASSASACSGT